MSVEIKNVKFKLSLPEEGGISAAGKEWKKCVAVFTTGGQYPKDIPTEAWNAQVPLIKTLKAGDDVNIHVDLEGREYAGKWYASIKLWKYDFVGAQENRAANAEAAKATPPSPQVEDSSSDSLDLPF